jgi:hypothetical protein
VLADQQRGHPHVDAFFDALYRIGLLNHSAPPEHNPGHRGRNSLGKAAALV